ARARIVGRLGTGLLLGVTATLTVAVLPGSASAAPAATRATTADQATKLVAEGNHDLEVVTEQINDAQDTLVRQQAAADAAGRGAECQGPYRAPSVAPQKAVVPQPAGPVPKAPTPAQVVARSGAAQRAVDTALAQLGDPYVWAAAGPNAFDCSGLTQYAYAAA